MPTNRSAKKSHFAALVGLAFDADDGHKRITRGENFFLLGGSDDTHGRMRDTVIKVNQRLDAQRRQLADVSVEELRDIFRDVQAERD